MNEVVLDNIVEVAEQYIKEHAEHVWPHKEWNWKLHGEHCDYKDVCIGLFDFLMQEGFDIVDVNRLCVSKQGPSNFKGVVTDPAIKWSVAFRSVQLAADKANGFYYYVKRLKQERDEGVDPYNQAIQRANTESWEGRR